MIRTLALAFVLSMLWLGASTRMHAQGAIEVTNNVAGIDFPNGLVFTLDATAGGAPLDARLSYRVAPDGVRTSAVAQCVAGATAHCTYTLANTLSNPLIPGAVVTYSWTLTAGTATQQTPEQSITYMDTRFDWQTVSGGNLTLWYYSRPESDARSVLLAGRESLDKIGALLKTQVTFPVKIFYYDSPQAMQPAIPSTNARDVVTLGEVVYSDTAMVAAGAEPQDIARHEVAHIVQREAMRGPYGGNEPDWLNEGLAVYAQSRPLSGQRQGIENAIRAGNVLSVRSMSSASSGALSDKVFLFYGESWSLVKFLIDTYGEDRFAQLFVALKGGATTGDALTQVYGFDQDGLENAWRQSVGLPPRTPIEATATPVATATATPSSSDGGSSTNVGLIGGVIAITAAIAAALVGAGLYLARRYR